MPKEKLQIEHDWFTSWILKDYDAEDVTDAWSNGESIEDFCLSHAGLLPINHIRNWHDIKNHFNTESYKGTEVNRETGKTYTSWSEYYEKDGYVHDPCFNGIPDTLEIEWVFSDTRKEDGKHG